MRYLAPERDQIATDVFQHPVFTYLPANCLPLIQQAHWPLVSSLNTLWPKQNLCQEIPAQFVAQESINDDVHYESRIYDTGKISTRSNNWHDLFNACIWLQFPEIKAALNTRQVEDIATVGLKQRTRSQCALTHFDEAGAVIRLDDTELLAAWNEHDWPLVFARWPVAVAENRLQLWLFGHSIYEHALNPAIALVAKALVIQHAKALTDAEMQKHMANLIRAQQCLRDPQELRPIPLSGIPLWHSDYQHVDFFQRVPCFQPKRAGKIYPEPLLLT